MRKVAIIGKVFLPIFAVALLCSCNSFDKLLKNPDFGVKYREAGKYYDKEKYDKAVTLYENILPFYRNAPQEDTINIRIARGYYKQHEYELAQYYYNLFRQSFPRSKFVEEADYMQGLCSYDLSLRPSLDQTETNNAIQSFNIYLYRYPAGQYVTDINGMIRELEGRLAEKAFKGAKLYYTTEHYKAAVVALKNCIKDYPDSPFREEMLYLVLRSSYLHAKHSVADKQRDRYQQSIDEYYNLVSEYPESKYKRDAEKIYKELQEKTKS